MRVLALALVLFLAGCGAGLQRPAPLSSEQAPSGPPAAAQVSVVPTGIRIPSIGASTTDVAPMGLDKSGAIEVPPLSEVQQLGYYCPQGPPKCGAPMPGSVGPAVVLGHINGNGKNGLFAKLDQVKVGAEVDVPRSDGKTAVFSVSKVQQVAKTDFPTEAVYGVTSTPQLRAISCGGRLDKAHHRYLDQTILYADLTAIR